MRNFKSAMCAAVLAAATSTTAFAAEPASRPTAVGPLAAGKPAGVKKAQSEDNTTLFWILGAGLVIGGIALVASGGGNDNTGTPATSGT